MWLGRFIPFKPKKIRFKNIFLVFFSILVSSTMTATNQTYLPTYEELYAPNLNLRDELTERRRAMVNKAFAMLDRDGSGQINIQDIAGIYDVSMNPEFLEGRKSREEILQDFLNNFDGAKGNNDGVVTMQEWTDYYTDLSMSTPSDEYFVRMMESTW